ncbi:MAG: hypothetical protein LAT65_02670 [Saccharospirillum sp.]|nr:hypothetical protein [Saccharospirillum sp.]
MGSSHTNSNITVALQRILVLSTAAILIACGGGGGGTNGDTEPTLTLPDNIQVKTESKRITFNWTP